MWQAAKPLVEQILLGLKTEEGLQGSLSSSILDDGDAVGQWASTQLAAVLFPRADTLDQACSSHDICLHLAVPLTSAQDMDTWCSTKLHTNSAC